MLPVNESAGAWAVVSKHRAGRHGWSMPILIRNGQHHYTNLVAFEDGVVDCWEGLDLPLFRDKLRTGWLATTAPVGARFSVFNLGGATVEAFEPTQSMEDLEPRVLEAMRHWNPTLASLVDLEGSATDRSKGYGVAKLPVLDGVPFLTTAADAETPGKEVPIFVRDGSTFRLTRWFVFADGACKIGPEGHISDIDAIERAVAEGTIATRVPDGEWIAIDGLGKAKLSQSHWGVDPKERVLEQQAHLKELQGSPDLVATCLRQWEAYEANPSPENLARVREAYLAVPKHLRIYCGDMDSKDWPIRRALGMIPRARHDD